MGKIFNEGCEMRFKEWLFLTMQAHICYTNGLITFSLGLRPELGKWTSQPHECANSATGSRLIWGRQGTCNSSESCGKKLRSELSNQNEDSIQFWIKRVQTGTGAHTFSLLEVVEILKENHHGSVKTYCHCLYYKEYLWFLSLQLNIRHVLGPLLK